MSDCCDNLSEYEQVEQTACFCFDFTIEDIKSDLDAHGCTDIPKQIANLCRQKLNQCSIKNPKGSCCLGDVNRIIKKLENNNENTN
jgi:hypothetical protein